MKKNIFYKVMVTIYLPKIRGDLANAKMLIKTLIFILNFLWFIYIWLWQKNWKEICKKFRIFEQNFDAFTKNFDFPQNFHFYQKFWFSSKFPFLPKILIFLKLSIFTEIFDFPQIFIKNTKIAILLHRTYKFWPKLRFLTKI